MDKLKYQQSVQNKKQETASILNVTYVHTSTTVTDVRVDTNVKDNDVYYGPKILFYTLGSINVSYAPNCNCLTLYEMNSYKNLKLVQNSLKWDIYVGHTLKNL